MHIPTCSPPLGFWPVQAKSFRIPSLLCSRGPRRLSADILRRPKVRSRSKTGRAMERMECDRAAHFWSEWCRVGPPNSERSVGIRQRPTVYHTPLILPVACKAVRRELSCSPLRILGAIRSLLYIHYTTACSNGSAGDSACQDA